MQEALFGQYFLRTRSEDDLRNDDCRLDSLTEDDEEDGDREQVLRHDENLATLVDSKDKSPLKTDSFEVVKE